MKIDIVIYHANCPDGLGGAWVFWESLREDCEYVPCSYGQEPPDVTGKTVAIVDFSFPLATLAELASKAKWMVLLDHHKTALNDLHNFKPENGQITFDMTRSGAQIAWDYLHPEQPRPWFINYIADRDLWLHKLPHTREISEALHFDGYYTGFEKLHELFVSSDQTGDIDRLAIRGSTLLEFKDRECAIYAAGAKPATITIDGVTYRVNLAGCPRQYRSDVGNLICTGQECDFACVYWYDFDSQSWWISCRATQEADIDLSDVIAKLPGGGGHPKAAGFTIKGESLETYFTRV